MSTPECTIAHYFFPMHVGAPPNWIVFLALLVGVLVSANRHPLDAPELHLFLELANVANARKKVRLSPLIVIIKGSKPFAPLFLGGLGFLKIANDGEFERREKAFLARERERHVERKCLLVSSKS
jgi:hypothetical protein